jgi:hypothetical protein
VKSFKEKIKVGEVFDMRKIYWILLGFVVLILISNWLSDDDDSSRYASSYPQSSYGSGYGVNYNPSHSGDSNYDANQRRQAILDGYIQRQKIREQQDRVFYENLERQHQADLRRVESHKINI